MYLVWLIDHKHSAIYHVCCCNILLFFTAQCNGSDGMWTNRPADTQTRPRGELGTVTCPSAKRWPTVGLLLNYRLRRWPDIKQTVGESRVFIRTLHILVSWWTRHGNTALTDVGTSQMWHVTTHVIDNRPITSQQAIGFYVMLTVGKHVINSFNPCAAVCFYFSFIWSWNC